MSEIPLLTTEAAFRERHGLTARAIADLRGKHLLPEIDWQKKGGAIHYTDTGAKKMAQVLEVSELLPASDAPAAPEEFVIMKRCTNAKMVMARKKNALALPADEPLTESHLLTLVDLSTKALASLRHQRLVEGDHWIREDGEVYYTLRGVAEMEALLCPPVRIKVRDNAQLRPGMVLQALPEDEANGLWIVTGKLPRRR